MADKILESVSDFDYTLVMDPNFTGLTGGEPEKASGGDRNEIVDRLYREYETMCLKDPTVVDVEDAYPKSYQWRMGDRYDQAKIDLLVEAVKEGKRIADLESYQEFLEEVSKRDFKPESWD